VRLLGSSDLNAFRARPRVVGSFVSSSAPFAPVVPLCRAPGRLSGLPSRSYFVRGHIIDILSLPMTSSSRTNLPFCGGLLTMLHQDTLRAGLEQWPCQYDKVIRECFHDQALSRSILGVIRTTVRVDRLQKLSLFA
jgi:hypothetical protein